MSIVQLWDNPVPGSYAYVVHAAGDKESKQ